MIVRREKGRGLVDGPLAGSRLTRVTPNRAYADLLVGQARAHLGSAVAIVDADPAGAFALVHDAARKSLTAVLVNQGPRTAGDGSHALLLDVVLAQLDPPPGARRSGPSRGCAPLRNHTRYPAPEHPVAQPDDVTKRYRPSRR